MFVFNLKQVHLKITFVQSIFLLVLIIRQSDKKKCHHKGELLIWNPVWIIFFSKLNTLKHGLIYHFVVQSTKLKFQQRGCVVLESPAISLFTEVEAVS